MKRQTVISIISALLTILWIYAAVSKLMEYEVFQMQLSRQPLPAWSISTITWALPILELVTAALLYFEWTRKAGLWISFILMASFTVYVALVLSHSFGTIPCACGGIFSKLKWKGHLVFNIIVTTMTAVGIHLNQSKSKNTNINIGSSTAKRAIE